ncbi:nucleotide-binding alpha-beta plait domain-containing protein, partial [Tanacetum coccineum]
MGIFRTKEDDVAKISTSIYVSNFPEVFSAKDLFHACKKYGHVIDSFIPFKKSKDGKRFGFVRFINVFNMERLVSNLCTIWVGRSKFHANVARFHRTPLKINKASKDNVYEPKRKSNVNENGSSKAGKSYAHVLKTHNSFEALDCESAPSIVLDDDCLNSRDLSKTLLGRVKEFASLSNLKVVLKNEGFDEIKLQYMGELWVLLEFPSSKIKELFQENRGVGSWFSVLKQTSTEFVPEVAPQSGGSILCVLEELVKVGQAMGYNMKGYVNNIRVLASDIIINRRMEVIKSIQYLDKIHVMDLAQKAKVKWAIEGDENSRYFHGVLNKKRSQYLNHSRYKSGDGNIVRGTASDWKLLIKVKISLIQLEIKVLFQLESLIDEMFWRFYSHNDFRYWSRVIRLFTEIDGESLEGSGEFSVASIRRFIDDQRLLTVDSKTLWIKSVPIKVNILAWKIKLEALPTRFNISRRGIEIDSILFPFVME